MDIRENILEELKKVAPKRRIKLTTELDFDYSDKTLAITIHDKGVGYGYFDSNGKVDFLNMQNDGAAFEGWAIILRTYWNKNEQYRVKLAVDCDLPDVYDVFINKQPPEDFSSGNYGRFLYRAYKFKEEFDWFELDERIDHAVKTYVNLITSKEMETTNHLQEDEAGLNPHMEIRVEKAFSDHPDELAKITKGRISGDVNRQLYVWL